MENELSLKKIWAAFHRPVKKVIYLWAKIAHTPKVYIGIFLI